MYIDTKPTWTLTAVAIEVFLKYCINSFAHKNKLDLTVDGIVYKLQKSDHSGHFLLCCDWWPLVPKLMVIGAFNRKLINYLGNHKIFKYFIK